jgi:hypothetical protein
MNGELQYLAGGGGGSTPVLMCFLHITFLSGSNTLFGNNRGNQLFRSQHASLYTQQIRRDGGLATLLSEI